MQGEAPAPSAVELPPSAEDVAAAEAAVAEQGAAVRALKEQQGLANQVWLCGCVHMQCRPAMQAEHGQAWPTPPARSCACLSLLTRSLRVHASPAAACVCRPQDPQVQAGVAELQARKQALAELQARYDAALAEAAAAEAAPPTLESVDEEDVQQ